MQGLDFGLNTSNNSGLDFGMDDNHSDFLREDYSDFIKKLRGKKKFWRSIKRNKSKNSNSKRGIGWLNRKPKGKSGKRITSGKRGVDLRLGGVRHAINWGKPNSKHTGVKIPASVLASRGKRGGLFGNKSCKEQLRSMRMGAGGMEKFVKKCESRGDFTASKVKKKEKIAEKLVANHIVKQERAMEKENSKRQAQQEENVELSKPITETGGFKSMLLPLIAGVGIIVLISMKK